jgi:hypothetical protein
MNDESVHGLSFIVKLTILVCVKYGYKPEFDVSIVRQDLHINH